MPLQADLNPASTSGPALLEGLAPAATSTATTARGRYEFLDVIRGLAALAVALQHGSEFLGLPLGNPHSPLNLGETGVVAFFLVSGFIIPRSLERHASLRLFWIGRAFRLYPAYWLSLLAALLLARFTLFPDAFLGLAHPGLGCLANVTMLQGLFRLPNAIGVYWTLGLELVFYLLCSILFAAGLLRHSVACLWAAIATTLAAVLAAAAIHHSLPAGRLGMLVSAFFGTVALRALTDHSARRALRRAAIPLAAVLTLGLYLRFGRFPVPHAIPEPPWLVVLPSWMLGYALFFLLFALRHRHFPGVLRWLGRISYSFYLWHGLIFFAVPRLQNPWLSLVFDLVITLAVADLSFRLVERPFLTLQQRLLSPARKEATSPTRNPL